MLKLRGVYCPLATPFDHAGELYPTKVRHNVQRLNRTRVAGVEVGGRVGEGSSLTAEERKRLFGLVAEAAEEKTLLAAVDSESLREAVDLAASARDAGYAAVTAHAPVGQGRADALLFFRILADRSPLPVVAVVNGVEPSAKTLAAHPNIAGLVDDAADGSGARAALALEDSAFEIAVSSQLALARLWEDGVRALFAPLANAVPFHLLSLEEALRMRETEAAEELVNRAARALDAAWLDSGPAGLKAAMDLRGCFGGAPRPPLPALAAEAREAVADSLEGLAS